MTTTDCGSEQEIGQRGEHGATDRIPLPHSVAPDPAVAYNLVL